MTDAERAALEALGYTGAWLESGLLDRERLAEQHERFEAGGTRKTGKYRAQSVAAFSNRRPTPVPRSADVTTRSSSQHLVPNLIEGMST